MLGSFLIGLGESIPILYILIYFSIASDEGFFLIDSNDFDDLCPLFGDIAFFIPFDDGGLYMIIVLLIVLALGGNHINLVVVAILASLLWVGH